MERIILNIVDNEIWDNFFVSKRPVSIAKWHGVLKHVTEVQKERILLREFKQSKLQDNALFSNYICSVATDTLGLYCSVNRQSMEHLRN
jgi:hypothetical protein